MSDSPALDMLVDELRALTPPARAEFSAWCARQHRAGSPPSASVWLALAAITEEVTDDVADEVTDLQRLWDDDDNAGAILPEGAGFELPAGWVIDGEVPR